MKISSVLTSLPLVLSPIMHWAAAVKGGCCCCFRVACDMLTMTPAPVSSMYLIEHFIGGQKRDVSKMTFCPKHVEGKMFHTERTVVHKHLVHSF